MSPAEGKEQKRRKCLAWNRLALELLAPPHPKIQERLRRAPNQ
jgi:hypothetical protein